MSNRDAISTLKEDQAKKKQLEELESTSDLALRRRTELLGSIKMMLDIRR